MSCTTGAPLSHTCLVKDFTIHQGAYWAIKIKGIKNADGTYVDLTGATFRGQARRDLGPSTAVAFSFTFTVDLLTDPAKHSVLVSIAATTTDALTVGKTPRDKDSVFYYDWELVDTLGNPHRIQMGRIYIARNATR